MTGAGIDETLDHRRRRRRDAPRPPTSPGAAGLFAPAYALWERDAPLPCFGHLADLSRALPGPRRSTCS